MKVGLIGCGRIARLAHLDALRTIPEVTVVALADPDHDRRREAQRRVPGATLFADYQELLADSEAEAVVLSLPPALHAQAAVAAFQAGKHVYVEKPLATSLEEAHDVVAAQERSGAVGMVGFNLRFHPLFRELKRQIRDGRIGRVVGVRTVLCTAARTLPLWKVARQTGGGALLDLASHHVDLVRFVFGQEVAEVSAEVRSVRSEDDTASVQIRLADGVPVQLLVSLAAAEEDRFEVYGDRGKLAADRFRMRRLEFMPPKRAVRRVDRLVDAAAALGRAPLRLAAALLPEADPTYRSALRAFAQAVLHRQPVAVSLDDGCRSLAAVLAAEESARIGRTVSLPTPSPAIGGRGAPATSVLRDHSPSLRAPSRARPDASPAFSRDADAL